MTSPRSARTASSWAGSGRSITARSWRVRRARARYTDIVSYDLRITWPNPGDASEPWIAVGATPYHSLWFDPGIASGVDVVFATCKRPDDSFTAVVEITPDDNMNRMDRFAFH